MYNRCTSVCVWVCIETKGLLRTSLPYTVLYSFKMINITKTNKLATRATQAAISLNKD